MKLLKEFQAKLFKTPEIPDVGASTKRMGFGVSLLRR